MFKNLKNNKGSIQDVFFLIVILFGVAIFLLIILFATGKINEVITPAFNSVVNGSGTIGMQRTTNIMIGSFDSIFLAIFIGYLIALIITAFLMQTHPAFIPIFILMLVVGIVLTPVLSNTYARLIQTPEFISTANNFPIMNFIMSRLPLVFLIAGIISLIVLFAKARSAQEGVQ